MKILKIINDAKITLVDLEVKIDKNTHNITTLCVQYKGKIIPLNSAHDGRAILMSEKNAI